METTCAELVALAASLDTEQRRAAEEGLTDDELALFDLLFKDNVSRADRERLKQASRGLLSSLRDLLRPMQDWTQKASTQAEVKVFILDNLVWRALHTRFYGPARDMSPGVGDVVWRSSRARDITRDGHPLHSEVSHARMSGWRTNTASNAPTLSGGAHRASARRFMSRSIST